MIVDFQRGRLPFFTRPPATEEEQEKESKEFNKVDPKEKNPLEEAEAVVDLTQAQKDIQSTIKGLDLSNVPDQVEN
jgi:hypothetical protein